MSVGEPDYEVVALCVVVDAPLSKIAIPKQKLTSSPKGRGRGGFLMCGYQKFCSLPKDEEVWPKYCHFCPIIGTFGHFQPNIGLAGSFGALLIGFGAQAALTIECLLLYKV